MKGSLSRKARVVLCVGLTLAVASPDRVLAQQANAGWNRNLNGPNAWREGGRSGQGGDGPHLRNRWPGGPRFGGFSIGVGGMAGLLITAGAAAAAANAASAEPERVPDERKRLRQTDSKHVKDRPETETKMVRPTTPPPAQAVVHAASPRAFVHAAPPRLPPPANAVVHAPPAPRLASNAHPPPTEETRFRPGEVLVETASGVSRSMIEAILRSHRLTEAEETVIGLTGRSLRLWRFPTSRSVPGVVGELGGETALASIQPNYIYEPQGDAATASPPFVDEYWLAKLRADKSLDLASGEPVRIAVIDTAVDAAHPDLNGSIEAEFDAIGGNEPTHIFEHGTSMVGAIAAHGLLEGVAPTVRILAARALDRDDHDLELGSTQSVMKAVQWAFDRRARIINMSFAGPMDDPGLHAELAAAYAKGMVLIAAAGNDGPKAPPRYPGADKDVVAVTATDASDDVFATASAGSYIAVAAPGVDVLLTAPNGAYAMQTGTSVSAALVSGVAALLIERSPSATPLEVRGWLTTTAKPLGLAAGAGLVDARRASEAASRPPGS